MKRFTKSIAMILVLVLLVSATPFAQAVEPRASAFFSSGNVFLHKTSATSFQVWFDVIGQGQPISEIGAISIRVERSLDQETWEVAQRYAAEDYSGMIAYGTISHDGYVTHYGTTGYYYRAIVGLYCKNENGTGISYHTTETIKL